jgi:glucose/mannose transport system substrate-binding protein
VNTLLYNPSVLDRAGVDPDALGGPAALRTALETVEAETDAVALSWPGDVPWQVGRLLEGVLLARTGTERYRAALESGFDASTVERAVGTVRDLTAFGRSDRDPGPTVESLLDGRVAMVAGGGRLVGGAASTSGLAARPDAAYGDDWAVTPFPGTAGTVQFGATAFSAPVEAPTPERSERWLRFVGSTPAQRRFSVAAGSFPLRTDADPSALPTPTADQYDAYRTAAARLPSITHRLVLAPDAYVRYLGALFRFDDEDRQDAVLETLTGVLSA